MKEKIITVLVQKGIPFSSNGYKIITIERGWLKADEVIDLVNAGAKDFSIPDGKRAFTIGFD